MKKEGKTAGEAWEICHDALRLRMEKVPKINRWLLKHLMHSSFLKKRMQRRAEENQKLRFGDFEVRYVMAVPIFLFFYF